DEHAAIPRAGQLVVTVAVAAADAITISVVDLEGVALLVVQVPVVSERGVVLTSGRVGATLLHHLVVAVEQLPGGLFTVAVGLDVQRNSGTQRVRNVREAHIL